jgi:hypothetical protein
MREEPPGTGIGPAAGAGCLAAPLRTPARACHPQEGSKQPVRTPTASQARRNRKPGGRRATTARPRSLRADGISVGLVGPGLILAGSLDSRIALTLDVRRLW